VPHAENIGRLRRVDRFQHPVPCVGKAPARG
jgi:hypothetical protein